MLTVINEAITEKDFQAAVINLARYTGWLVYHTHDSRRSEPGFPDLVLAKDKWLVTAELKTEKGTLTPAQTAWILALRETGNEVYVWRPSDWEQIQERLTRVIKA